jgi:RimJ/RimL family protein N-acetyltransferase
MHEKLAGRLEGRVVVLEPLAAGHRNGLWRIAAADPPVWNYMTARLGDDRATFDRWFDDALAEAAAGQSVPFATTDAASGEPLGSSRFMTLRPEHRSVEIGHTWLVSSAWGTGANVEAKYLMLRRAIEEAGCLRVEFKTDAANERSCAALAALPARFEGVHRKHMLVRGGERRDSAWFSVIDDDWPEVRPALERRIDAKVAARA